MANEIKSASFFFPFVSVKAVFNYVFGYILISLQNDLFKLCWATIILFRLCSVFVCLRNESIYQFPKRKDDIVPDWYSKLFVGFI